jgi:hypothetical protein
MCPLRNRLHVPGRGTDLRTQHRQLAVANLGYRGRGGIFISKEFRARWAAGHTTGGPFVCLGAEKPFFRPDEAVVKQRPIITYSLQ